jgi:hypothetical protein
LLLTKIQKANIRKISNILELQLFIIKTFEIEYEWIANISDIDLLKDLTCSQLFNQINTTLDNNISNCNTSGIGKNTIQKLYDSNVYSKEQYDNFMRLKIRKKPNNVKGKHWQKKRKKEKAVSQWLTAFAVIILLIQP